jgi:DNA-binding NarL/FixJ family response regulator
LPFSGVGAAEPAPRFYADVTTATTSAATAFAVQSQWGLSTRHARVLELVSEGLSNKEIAGHLACAEVTVENHVTELFRKSGARSRAGLVGRLIQGRGTHE